MTLLEGKQGPGAVSTWEAKPGGSLCVPGQPGLQSRVSGQPQLHSETLSQNKTNEVSRPKGFSSKEQEVGDLSVRIRWVCLQHLSGNPKTSRIRPKVFKKRKWDKAESRADSEPSAATPGLCSWARPGCCWQRTGRSPGTQEGEGQCE